ncbi:hypothetical protein M758_UG159700 [Ceratodon purpureus]|nr:hypothetical protein M758_UG159700 [Ceratodon purpureus]
MPIGILFVNLCSKLFGVTGTVSPLAHDGFDVSKRFVTGSSSPEQSSETSTVLGTLPNFLNVLGGSCIGALDGGPAHGTWLQVA